MPEDDKAPRHNYATTKVTIAWPFSQIKLTEPDERVTALAELVVDLARKVAELSPGDESNALLERAETSLRALG
jgi:hypothetical protein